MEEDIRTTALYREAEALFTDLRQPGSGLISDGADIHASPNGTEAVFVGTVMSSLQGSPTTRVCRVDLNSGQVRICTDGPGSDRLPKFSPDGRQIAFLSDRHQSGDFQLYLQDSTSGLVTSTPRVEGWVEYLHWSTDGSRILLGVAGRGAETSGAQGAMASRRVKEDSPAWLPNVATGDEEYRWRSAWIYSVSASRVQRVSRHGINIWEAAWCGRDHLCAVTSPGPGEALWYRARLQLIDANTGDSTELYIPGDQLGLPTPSPSGEYIAVVEALSSDRWYVAGVLLLIDRQSGAIRRIETSAIDVTFLEWRSKQNLLVGGHRGLETVLGLYDVRNNLFTEIWCSTGTSSVGRYFAGSGIGGSGDCVIVGEGFTRAPEIAVIRSGTYECVTSLDLGYASASRVVDAVEPVYWSAPDGLEMQGWLLRPTGQGPHPLIMNIHGGPVWHWRPAWLGRWAVAALMLLKRGYALFYPNPRGSSGRGQAFARGVLGDAGGADTFDYLSGLDHLVRQGIADAERLGVTGGSYGGFMTSWLITQDERFAAAVPVAPHTNNVTAHLLSSIPQFVALFVGGNYADSASNYFQRSPVMHARKARTPTLNICGALDRSAPPEEAAQFHAALVENGVESVLVTYPEEGHGVRNFPAAIDYAARVVAWFESHMSAERA